MLIQNDRPTNNAAGRPDTEGRVIKLIIADDHKMVRESMAHMLKMINPNFEVVGSYDTATAVLEHLASDRERPDIMLLDLVMEGMDTFLESSDAPGMPPFLVVSGHIDRSTAVACLSRGARGVIPKCAASTIISQAIDIVALHDGHYMSSEFGEMPDAQWMKRVLGRQRDERLTEREQEVLDLVVDGLSNKEIARELGLVEITIKTHVKSILRKYSVKNRVHLIKMIAEKRA